MTDIGPQLQRLGLEQYHNAFVGEGFDTWETLLDIQEADLDALNVKLGHRRKLQRAIAEYRGFSSDRPLGSPSHDGPADSARSSEAGPQPGSSRDSAGPQAAEQKRKYRRHPKSDENAPEKPPSAYVIFSNKIREEVKSENLSFTEIARLVGERWQKLDPGQKEPFESQAATLKEQYLTQLADYKKTDAYKEYLHYLADFKAKHGHPIDSKRPRLDMNSSSSAASTGQDVEMATQGARHTRGGSLGSLSTTSHSGALPSPAGVALAPVLSLPNIHNPAPRPPGMSGRGNSPTSTISGHDGKLPGQLSSQSSLSEESSAARPEHLDTLSRTASLSLNTPPAVTPPLPSSTSMSGRSEHGSTSDPRSWAQRHPHVGHGFPSTAGASPSGRAQAHPSSYGSGDLWRERAGDPGRVLYPPSNLQSNVHSASLPISQLLGSEHSPDTSHGQAPRTLPPLRVLPNVMSIQSSVLPPLSNSSHRAPSLGLDSRPPAHLGQLPLSFNRSENEAASTLARLSQRQSPPESDKPDNSPRQPR